MTTSWRFVRALLIAYAALTAYISLSPWFGMRHGPWTTVLLTGESGTAGRQERKADDGCGVVEAPNPQGAVVLEEAMLDVARPPRRRVVDGAGERERSGVFSTVAFHRPERAPVRGAVVAKIPPQGVQTPVVSPAEDSAGNRAAAIGHGETRVELRGRDRDLPHLSPALRDCKVEKPHKSIAGCQGHGYHQNNSCFVVGLSKNHEIGDVLHCP